MQGSHGSLNVCEYEKKIQGPGKCLNLFCAGNFLGKKAKIVFRQVFMAYAFLLDLSEAVLTLRDMTSDAQTPLAHATMLRDTSGF